MIPDEVKFFVRDALDNRNIATLDESFVVNNLGIGEFFISRGTPWKVLDISEREVLVEPAEDISGAIPAWEGEQIPVPYYIAQEVGRLRKEVVNEKFNFPEYCMDGAAFVEAHSLMKKQAEHYVPDEKTVAVETADNFLIMHCHFGSLVNETLAKVLSVLVSAYTGASITTKSDPYRIVFQFPSEPRPDLVKKFLFETRPESLGSILERSLLRTTLFRYRFIHVAKRFGLIEKQHDYQKISIRKLIEAVLDSPIYRETLSEIFTEKLDVETAKEVLRDIQDSKIRFVEHPGQPTPLTLYSLKRLMSFPDLVLPGRPEAEIIRIMKARINNKRAKLFCTFCKSIFYERIDRLPQKINCPHCQSNMVSYAKADENIAEIWGKARSDAEKKKRKEYEQIAVLVSTYGKRAIIVLSGHGIGPDAATRILGRLRKSDEELYRDMLDAQRDFLRTHRYWS
jgi:ATP-dependent Lhr-like helicase